MKHIFGKAGFLENRTKNREKRMVWGLGFWVWGFGFKVQGFKPEIQEQQNKNNSTNRIHNINTIHSPKPTKSSQQIIH